MIGYYLNGVRIPSVVAWLAAELVKISSSDVVRVVLGDLEPHAVAWTLH